MPPSSGAATGRTLDRVRREIDDVDRRLVELMAERTRRARDAGAAKTTASLPPLDPAREAAVVRNAAALARERGLPDEEVRAVFWRLVAMARGAQGGP